ncbi:hypothetical protein Pmani_021665 [Petrolisthes manimaculis]|uniref:Uncharacterized protein n=1 Tax=Petrolisthes manimaculis TaxID=1843537 RepID=A0AAE1PFD0_9EUCA|nr:hypothetical protein Pmani_021665 [Petrolisthes manimaculis]
MKRGEHQLMVQWEPDIVCDDDSSIIVRCDRPDDFNKTVEWRLETRQLLATLEHSQHPELPVAAAVVQDTPDCFQPYVFYATVITLACIVLLLVIVLIVTCMKERIQKRYPFLSFQLNSN